MALLTDQEARGLLNSRFINQSEVAREMFPESTTPRQALRQRLLTKPLSEDTLERLTVVFARVYNLFSDTNFI